MKISARRRTLNLCQPNKFARRKTAREVAKNETLNRLFAKSNRSALGKNGKMDPPPLVRAAGCKFIVAPHRFPTYVVPRHIFLLTRQETNSMFYYLKRTYWDAFTVSDWCVRERSLWIALRLLCCVTRKPLFLLHDVDFFSSDRLSFSLWCCECGAHLSSFSLDEQIFFNPAPQRKYNATTREKGIPCMYRACGRKGLSVASH